MEFACGDQSGRFGQMGRKWGLFTSGVSWDGLLNGVLMLNDIDSIPQQANKSLLVTWSGH